MPMPKFGEHFYFRLEFVHALIGKWIPTFDCDFCRASIDFTFVDFPEPTDTEEEGFVEVVGGGFDLGEGEVAAEVGRVGGGVASSGGGFRGGAGGMGVSV